MRKLHVLVFGLALFLVVNSASAWEFSMKGDVNWEFRHLSSIGSNGLFGPHYTDASGSLGANFAAFNFWGGVNDFLNSFYSGAAAVQTMWMDVYPEIRINKAIKIKGKYRVGEFGQADSGTGQAYTVGILPGFGRAYTGTGEITSAATEYRPNSSRSGTDVAFSDGQWMQLWFSAETPWGALVYGKRPFTFGLGTWINGEDNTTAESLALVAPYGPFKFMAEWYPARQILDPSQVPLSLDGDDTDFLRSPEIGVAVTYRSGPVDIGSYWRHTAWEVRPTSLYLRFDPDFRIHRDFNYDLGAVYFKYFNGRFFLNFEWDFMYGALRNRQNSAGFSPMNDSEYVGGLGIVGSGSVFQTTYTEMNRFALELGALAGPAKVTAMWAWIPGFDRRHGIYIDRQPNAFWIGENAQYETTSPAIYGHDARRPMGMVTCHPDLSNAGFFMPYSYLMVHQFGVGVGTAGALPAPFGPFVLALIPPLALPWTTSQPNVTRNLDGQLADANVYAARVDYALAANLNVFTSFFWAERLSHGYGWGHIGQARNNSRPFSRTVTFDNRGNFNEPSPAIPDSFLGWEFGFGVDWKLLEGMMLNTRFAYWQPGGWWKYACVSKDNPDWLSNYDAAANNWGVNPNRSIDPIIGFEIALKGEF